MGEKTLLAYVSAGGATEAYANTVADVLTSRGRQVDVVNMKREKIGDLAPYGSVVVGAGVRMGMVYRAAKRLLRRKDLKGKRVAIFLSSGMAIESPDRSKEKFLAPIVAKYGLDPLMYDAFPGTMPGSGGKVEDKTDMEVARRWAEELAGKLS
jgi:menaquinone-dependent protoporphyrinogen IX oxidase